MLVQLNAFLLRLGVNPFHAIGDISKNPPQMHHWDGSSLTELSADDVDLLEAAVDGDMVMMTFRPARIDAEVEDVTHPELWRSVHSWR